MVVQLLHMHVILHPGCARINYQIPFKKCYSSQLSCNKQNLLLNFEFKQHLAMSLNLLKIALHWISNLLKLQVEGVDLRPDEH